MEIRGQHWLFFGVQSQHLGVEISSRANFHLISDTEHCPIKPSPPLLITMSTIRIAPTVSSKAPLKFAIAKVRTESRASYEPSSHSSIYASTVLSLSWQSFPSPPSKTFLRPSRTRQTKPTTKLCHPSGSVKTEGVCI